MGDTAELDLSAPPPALEYKTASGVLLDSDDEKGIVECLVSITGIVDDQNDIIVPGAYAETLAARRMKGVRYHDWSRVAAKTLVQEEWLPGDSRLPKTLPDGMTPWPAEAGALYVKGQYNLETKDGQEGYSNAKFFADQGQWSIGYQPVKGQVSRNKQGQRVLGKVHAYEWSDVAHGANTSTSTLGVKSADGGGFGTAFDDDVLDDDGGEKFNPAQPRATDGRWTAGGGSSRSSSSGSGGTGLGADWLERVLAGDPSLVEKKPGGRGGGGRGGGSGGGAAAKKKERDAEKKRRDKVKAALDKERDAERKRREAADKEIASWSGGEKKRLQNEERERRAAWQEAYDAAREAERERRRKWADVQRGKNKKEADPVTYADLDADLDLDIDNDPLTDDDGDGDGEDDGEGQKDGMTAGMETKVRDVLPGSYEERRDALREAARQALAGPKNANGDPEWWVYVVGTWEDRMVVNRMPRGDGDTQTWQIPYTIGADGTITLGEMVRVQLVAQVVPATATKTAQVADATVNSVVDLIEDAAAQLSMAASADIAGIKGAQVGGDGAGRLQAAAALLYDALTDAGVDLDDDGDGEPGEKTGEPNGETTVLDLAEMQAQIAALRDVQV